MVIKKRTKIIVVLAIIFIIVLGIGSYNYSQQKYFSVKTSLLRLNIPLEGEGSTVVKITNNKDTFQSFKISFNDFNGIGFIDENEFSLGPGESKDLKINFKDSKGVVEIYLGKLIIEGELIKKEIPVILSVENSNQVFAIIQKVIPKYDEVYPGGKFGFEIKVFEIGEANLKTINGEFLIKDSFGEILWSDKGSLVVDGEITQIIDIPKDWGYGDYLFETMIEYNGIKTKSGYFFAVSEKSGEVFSGSLKFFILIIVLFVFGVLILFFYFMQARDELFIELRKRQNRELQKQMELVKVCKVEVKKIKSPVKRKEKIKKLEKIKKKIVKKIRKKQKIQKRIIMKLKKQGKKDEIKKKIHDWNKQGYKMFGDEEKEMKKITGKSIEKQLKNLKSKGYDTSFLSK
ncbi:MAG: hypothetical protein AABX88_02630 [Nanoarchaeota archaeon]